MLNAGKNPRSLKSEKLQGHDGGVNEEYNLIAAF